MLTFLALARSVRGMGSRHAVLTMMTRRDGLERTLTSERQREDALVAVATAVGVGREMEGKLTHKTLGCESENLL